MQPPSHSRNTGSVREGLVSAIRYRGFLFQATPAGIVAETTAAYRPYRSSHAECRCGRSGSSSLPDSFRLRHWCGCAPVPTVRSCRERCRYRYICRLSGFPARGGCRLF